MHFDTFQVLVTEAIRGLKKFWRPEANDLSHFKDWLWETSDFKFELIWTPNTRENWLQNFKLKLQLIYSCYQAEIGFGRKGLGYVWSPIGSLTITLRAEAPEASKVFWFWPPRGSMEAARSNLQKNPKNHCQELSREVWHASLAQKLSELEQFEFFNNIGHILVSHLNPPFLRPPLTSDPTYVGSPNSAWCKEGIWAIFRNFLKFSF